MKPLAALALVAASLLPGGISCRDAEPATVLPESKFVSAYARLTAATVTARPLPQNPDGLAVLVDSILALEGVTREQFEATMRWYNQDVKRWKPFFDEVVRVLEDSARMQRP